MSFGSNQQEQSPFEQSMFLPVAAASRDVRADFINKTYMHLAGAMAMFVGIEVMLFQLPFRTEIVQVMFASQISWLVVLGLFMGVSWLASSWANSATSIKLQYAGLGLYVVAQAVIFLPLLLVADAKAPDIIPTAAITTLVLFGALTAVVMLTKADFSFMRSILMFAGFAALALIVVSIVFNFQLGPIFTVAMIAFACGYILYDTSNVLHVYRPGQHVAAALALFASVALLFWYIVQLFMRRD